METAKSHLPPLPAIHTEQNLALISRKVGIFFAILLATLPLAAREKDAVQYGSGLIVNVPFAESEVVQVVQDVIQNGIIRGSKEYNKDEYITGATAADSTRAFKE